MRVGMRLRLSTVGSVLVCLASLAAWAMRDKAFAMPRAFHAKTYPAHEEHEGEKLVVAIDPYDLPDKAEIFRVNYRKIGFMPTHVVISNDDDEPVSLVNMKVELITVGGSRIPPAAPDDIYRRLARRPSPPARNPLPLPMPRLPKPRVKPEYQEEIEAAQFRARAVEPHGTQDGFFFFQVDDLSHPLAGAHLYVSGIRNADGKELFYFEVPLEKYLTYQPAK